MSRRTDEITVVHTGGSYGNVLLTETVVRGIRRFVVATVVRKLL